MSPIKVAALFGITLFSQVSLAQTTIADMPANLKESVEWVWNNRIVPRSSSAPIGEGSVTRQNIIIDQIYDAGGELHYIVRWQSSKTLTLAQRQKFQPYIERHINNWAQHLVGFENWPYGHIPVKIVGWAVDNAALIQDKQADEVVYTDYIADGLHNEDASIPANLPIGPDNCSRFEHFTDNNYTYSSCPQGPEGRFDMYLWATENWSNYSAVGGDWGQRMSDVNYINSLNSNEYGMFSHEIGHGFGITDFYGASERPPNGFPVPTIMWAGNSPTITSWDAWMLRYIWYKISADTQRFPPRSPVSSSSVVVSSSSIATSSSSVASSSSTTTCSQSITPYYNLNAGTWQTGTTITTTAGDNLIFGPQPNVETNWTWTGPNGFTANTREIELSNLQVNQSGTYTATYTGNGCNISESFNLTVQASTLIQAQLNTPWKLQRLSSYTYLVPLPLNTRSLELIDMQGKRIATYSTNTDTSYLLNLESLPAGLYILRSHSQQNQIYRLQVGF